MTNTIKSPGSLTLGADLDNLSVGVYQITGVKINVLGTAVTIWGTIIVCRRAFDYQQVILSNGTKAIYYRSKNESEAWTEWKQLVTNTDLGIVYHPNINIPSTKTAIENYIKTNLGTLRRFNTVRSDPAAGSESGILPGGTSFCILWQCSSVAYGWVTLYSDLIGRPIVYGIINGTFTWYTPNLTQI